MTEDYTHLHYTINKLYFQDFTSKVEIIEPNNMDFIHNMDFIRILLPYYKSRFCLYCISSSALRPLFYRLSIPDNLLLILQAVLLMAARI